MNTENNKNYNNNEINSILLRNLRIINRRTHKSMRRRFGDDARLGREQFRLLMAIIKNEGNRAKFFAEHFEVSAPTITQQIQVLQSKGYIVCKNDESDNRAIAIFPTDSGKKLVHELRASRSHARSSASEKMFSNFTEQEKQDLLALTSKIIQNLSKDLSEDLV